MDRVQKRRAHSVQKQKVYDHYGHFCACCGETEEMFLTLGHVDGSGAEHRRRLNGNNGGNTVSILRDLIKRGYPDNIRVECTNCNVGAYRNGGVCPHVKLRQAPIERLNRLLQGALLDRPQPLPA